MVGIMAAVERKGVATGVGIYPNLILDAASGVCAETMPITIHPSVPFFDAEFDCSRTRDFSLAFMDMVFNLPGSLRDGVGRKTRRR